MCARCAKSLVVLVATDFAPGHLDPPSPRRGDPRLKANYPDSRRNKRPTPPYDEVAALLGSYIRTPPRHKRLSPEASAEHEITDPDRFL